MLVGSEDGTELLAEAGTADEALRSIARVRRSRVVVLVGLGLDGPHDASWLIREVRERYPFHAVLAVGANADPTTISRALFVGADGFVDKRVEPHEFLASIVRAGEREMVLAGPTSSAVGSIADGIDRRREINAMLTPREREVLAIAAQGLTAREMAERLGVRERTVTTHLGRIYGKLGVGSRLAAVRMAARSGLVSVGTPE
jgi:DNA-binding NarL/FixJ family response regulator